MEKPIVTEAFADNGEHSHWRLINPSTGELLWTEDPQEDLHGGYLNKVINIKNNSGNIQM